MADKKAVGYLQRKLTGNFSERAWATVLLVKMGEFKDAEAIRTMALKVPDNFSSEQWRSAAYNAQQDFCYALLLLDPNPQSELYRGLSLTQLERSAQTASDYVKEAAERLDGSED